MFCPDCGASISKDIMLTKRQCQVLEGISKGLTNQEIATELGVTYGTLKVYTHHLLRKTAYRNRTALSAAYLTGAYRPHACQEAKENIVR